MRWNRELRQRGIRDLAAIIVEVESGEPAAYCGNSDLSFDRDGKWVDIARSPRSSGSILKPLLYAAALEQGTILPNSLLPDVPMDFGGFAPKNFDGTYAGAIEADQALALFAQHSQRISVERVRHPALCRDAPAGRIENIITPRG